MDFLKSAQSEEDEQVVVVPNQGHDDREPRDAFPFLVLPLEIQALILTKTNTSQHRELKLVSKQFKNHIDRVRRRDFFYLPPKLQLKILNQTDMSPLELRQFRLVSKDMKYLVEHAGYRQIIGRIVIHGRPSGGYSCSINLHYRLDITFSDLLRLFKGCTLRLLWFCDVEMTSEFCEQLHHFIDYISCECIWFTSCGFNEKEGLAVVDPILCSTKANTMGISWDRTNYTHVDNDFFAFSSVRNLKFLLVKGDCDFSDDDLLAGKYSSIQLTKCGVSERTLRRILEETLECSCRIEDCDFGLRNTIDVDRLTSGLPNLVNTGESRWELTNTRDQLRHLTISANEFILNPLF